mmetsp:Transcript_10644/g.10731  ORF Transcript_10644/g.10731 Transcript_10644/m.10731 type:complete len:340 (-) Transcript_10644:4108-5127(-)
MERQSHLHRLLHLSEPDVDRGVFGDDDLAFEVHILALSGVHPDEVVPFILKVHGRDPRKHLREVPLHHLDLFGVPNDFQQVFIAHEVEASEVGALLLEVVAEGLLDLAEHVREPLQSFLEALDGDHLQHHRLRRHLLHQRGELIVDALELGEFCGQHGLDVSGAKEDAFQVHVAPLHIDPVVEDDADLLQTLIPRDDLLLEHFVVGRHLHGLDVVDVLVDLLEQLVPPSDQPTLRLVLYQLQLVVRPYVLDVPQELLQDQLATRLTEDVPDNFVILDQVCLPQVAQVQIIEVHFDLQLDQQVLPVAGLHGVRLQLAQGPIHLPVLHNEGLVFIIDLVLP